MANFEPTIVYNDIQVNVGDLMYRAARMARVLKSPGQGLSPSESQEFLGILNAMVDGFKTEALMIPYTRRTLMPVVLNQKVYGVGPGQDWDIERPEKITRCGFLIPGATSSSEIQMHIILSYEEYADYVIKEVTSNFPLVLYYEASSPFGAATLWPVPSQAGQVAIYTPQFLSEFSTPDDILYARAGVREMLMYNLAVAIHEVYPERPMAPSVETNAYETKRKVKANQLTPMRIRSDDGAIQDGFANGWCGGTPRAWTPYS